MLWLTEDQCSRLSNDVRFRPVADVRDCRAQSTSEADSALTSFVNPHWGRVRPRRVASLPKRTQRSHQC